MTEEFKKSLIEKGNLSLKLNINTLFVEKLEGHTDNVTSLAYNKEKKSLSPGVRITLLDCGICKLFRLLVLF